MDCALAQMSHYRDAGTENSYLLIPEFLAITFEFQAVAMGFLHDRWMAEASASHDLTGIQHISITTNALFTPLINQILPMQNHLSRVMVHVVVSYIYVWRRISNQK